MMKKKNVVAIKQLVENFQECISTNLHLATQLQKSIPASKTNVSKLPINQEEINVTTKVDGSSESASIIRDTFSLPAAEYQIIEEVRVMAAKEGHIHTKSEIIRAALFLLSTTPHKARLDCLSRVERLKPGRK
jgi:hypothetical protein